MNAGDDRAEARLRLRLERQGMDAVQVEEALAALRKMRSPLRGQPTPGVERVDGQLHVRSEHTFLHDQDGRVDVEAEVARAMRDTDEKLRLAELARRGMPWRQRLLLRLVARSAGRIDRTALEQQYRERFTKARDFHPDPPITPDNPGV